MDDFNGLGGGVLLAVVVLLWLVYLVPSWISKYQYVTTERNATRIQQAMRVIRHVSDEGDVVVETELTARKAAILAREAKKQQKIALQVEKAQAKAATRAAAQAAREQRVRAEQAARASVRSREAAMTTTTATPSNARLEARRRQAKALRRGRLLATSVGVIGVAGTIASVALAARFPVLWVGASMGVLFVVVAAAMLQASAHTARAYREQWATQPRSVNRERVQIETPATAASEQPDMVVVAADSETEREWTPAQMPKPLYLTHSAVRAAAEAEARRVAEAEQGVESDNGIQIQAEVEAIAETVREEQGVADETVQAAALARSQAAEELKRATDEAVDALRAAQADDAVAKIETARPEAEYEWLTQLERETAEARTGVRGSKLDDALRRRRQVG